MFTRMKAHHGFLGAEMIPPTGPGEDYQVVVNFASEADLAQWDSSTDRAEIFARMREHALGEPQHRRLSAVDAWFEGPLVPGGVRPQRWRVAVVTWLGIWPLASLAIFFLSPRLSALGLPFLLVTAISTMCIVAAMTWLVSPVLTNLLKGFLAPRQK